ncbi:hypothetical protein EXN61_11405 [Agrobacterium tumefaciens]|uniref:Uncharacterized protein n=1 Tax=Agrobacterium tumefaciens TaxID=358 RepID=A0A546XYK8_AGRTU|nr:hypothetical protein [Agrobacterium tumefaciens]TRB05834.1 hypothetical protein EXN61_11405 [Agrobacterium tumefaciens]
MSEFRAFDKAHQTVISGATVWDYTNSDEAVLFGATQSDGRLTISGQLPQRLRIIAPGYVPIDTVLHDVEAVSLGMERLHPGAYSGFLPHASSTTWSSERGGDFRQFTSTGLYRQAKSVDELTAVKFLQYKMIENEEWCGLFTRVSAFPTFGRQWTSDLTDFTFRFPEPGTMLARSIRTRDVIKFLRAN